MKTDFIRFALDKMVPEYKCELNYNKDYELLIAVMLSAQCTDKRVNAVMTPFFEKHTLNDIALSDIKDLEKIIYPLGSFHKKALYMKEIAISLLQNYNGIVPCNREYLESLPGIGRKSCNVVLAELYNVPTIAVDTHVERVSKRLGIVKQNDNVVQIEKKLMKLFDQEEYNKINHQFILFGRYICTAKKPNCEKCTLKCKKRQDI